ncbi:MAG: class I SAM-dependent methyltransferase [Planctomycetota bacterium]
MLYLDVRQRFPFDDETFDYVFTEHLIEHVTFEEGESMLRECHRVLKPAGRIRVSTPDLDRLLGLWRNREQELPQRYVRWVIDSFLPHLAQRGKYHPVHVINSMFQNWGHLFLYNADLLKATLEEAGFSGVETVAHGESSDPELRGVEAHGVIVENVDMVRYEALAVEGQKAGR